ncbi:hypothetical protein ACIHAR_28925 [Streptomyces sp. NPDC052016]
MDLLADVFGMTLVTRPSSVIEDGWRARQHAQAERAVHPVSY